MHDAGYFMGENLYSPQEGNPKGFFENEEINGVNEIILSSYDRRHQSLLKRYLQNSINFNPYCQKLMPVFLQKYFISTVYTPAYLQRWLMSLAVDVDINTRNKKVEKKIKAAVSRKPFAYKDPRFSYTLPVWRKYLDKNTIFICVFREPNVTVKSILKECSSARYLHNLRINESQAYEVWQNMYLHILTKHIESNDAFVFIHYDQIYEGSVLLSLSNLLGVELKHNFVSKELRRTYSDSSIPEMPQKIYNKLCKFSGCI